LHQRDREPDGRAAAGLPQRQTLARCTDGFALDWYRHAGGREELPPFEGPQAAPNPAGRVVATSESVARRATHCQKKSGCIGFNQWRLLHQFQQAPGLSGIHIQRRHTAVHCRSEARDQLLDEWFNTRGPNLFPLQLVNESLATAPKTTSV